MSADNPVFPDESQATDDHLPSATAGPTAESQSLPSTNLEKVGITPDQDQLQPRPGITFQGNTYDLSAVVAVTISGLVLLICITCNFATYFIPCLPIVLGIFGLATASNAVNSERTTQLSWISIAAGVVIWLLILLVILAYVGFFFLMVNSGEFSP